MYFMNSKEKKWIDVGYKLFAKEGPKGLKIDQMAKSLDTSRSSFYYHFADLEIFTSDLFDYHIKQSVIMCETARKCEQMDPDFFNAIIEFQEDILFHRQLRIHRHLPDYITFIEKAHFPIEQAFLEIWAKELNLEYNLSTAQILLKLVVENFYMRISEDSFNITWLSNYLQEIIEMMQGMSKSN